MDIEVVHVNGYGKKSKALEDQGLYVYCGRPSKLGNPFVMKSETDRDIVIQKFKEHLPMSEISELFHYCMKHQVKTLKLGCYCSPLPCHADEIKIVLNNMFSAAILSFSSLDFTNDKNLTVRLKGDSPEFKIGDFVRLSVGDKNTAVKIGIIKEVIPIQFSELNDYYETYLRLHTNSDCRTYSGLLSKMNSFYKTNIEKRAAFLIFFKVLS